MSNLLYIIVSLMFSAFFSGTEIAYVSVNKFRIRIDGKDQSLTSKILRMFTANNGQFISTLLVGNNIALVVYGIKMAEVMAQPIMSVSLYWGWELTEAGLSVIQVVLSTILVIFVGEFIPKALFRGDPYFFLRMVAVPMWVFYVVLYPVAIFASKLSVGILKLCGVKVEDENGKHPMGRVDLSYLIEDSIERTPENEVESEVRLFRNALDLSDVKLRNCVVPRTEIVSIEIGDTEEELKTQFIESGNSKVIVYKENIDNVIGYVDSAELFKPHKTWQESVKPIAIVPETMAANKLLNLFIKNKKNIAVVVDEFGGTSGIVTLEDIMEEIFGEIKDEHDTKEYIVRQNEKGEYILSGRLEIAELNTHFGKELIEESDDYITVAGFILCHHERLPKAGDRIQFGKYDIRILKMQKNKIELVRMKIENNEG